MEARYGSRTLVRLVAAASLSADAPVSAFIAKSRDKSQNASDFKKVDRASWVAVVRGDTSVACARLKKPSKNIVRNPYS